MAPAGEQTRRNMVVTGLVALSLIAVIAGSKLWEQPCPDCNIVAGNPGSDSLLGIVWIAGQDLARSRVFLLCNESIAKFIEGSAGSSDSPVARWSRFASMVGTHMSAWLPGKLEADMRAQNWDEVLTRVRNDDIGKWDSIMASRTIKAHDNGTLTVGVQGSGGIEYITPSDHALGQMCGRLEIPTRYLKRLPPDKQAMLVNYDLERIGKDNGGRKFMLRCKGRIMRAFLSDKYSRIDNIEVLETIAELSSTFGHEFRDFHLSESGFWAKILIDDLHRPDPSNPSSDLKVGMLVGNSEVGSRLVTIEPFVYRFLCTNDLVVQVKESLKARHLHLKRRELKGRVIEAVGHALKSGDKTLDALTAAYEEKVESPADVIKKLAEKRGMSQKMTDEVKLAFEAEPQENKMGVVNAFTRAAQTLEPDERIDLERFAGKLLEAHLPTA